MYGVRSADGAPVEGGDKADGAQSEDPGTESKGADLVVVRDRRGAVGPCPCGSGPWRRSAPPWWCTIGPAAG